MTHWGSTMKSSMKMNVHEDSNYRIFRLLLFMRKQETSLLQSHWRTDNQDFFVGLILIS